MTTEFMLRGLPFGVAIILGLLLPLLAFAQYRLAGRATPATRTIVATLALSTGTILTAALTPRMLNMAVLVSDKPVYVDYGEAFMASRFMNLAIVGACAVEILRGWVTSHSRQAADPARPVLYALIIFFFGIILIHLVASEHRDFSFKTLYVPIILIAVYYQRVEDLDRVLQAVKLGIFACTAGSLLAMVVSPDSVMYRPAPGVIPGINFRLFGLAPHPNALGPVALLGLMLELYAPARRTWLRWLYVVSALAVFVLAQSKTVWLAAFIIFAVVHVPLAISRDPHATKRGKDFERAVTVLLVCIAVVAVAVCIEWVSDVSGYIARKADLSTLTGRTKIWELTLDAWRENRLFGYGLGLWGPQFRAQYGMPHVGQAHNQFLQTLGDAGIAGLVLLLGYLGVYLTVALKHFFPSRGIVLTLLAMLGIQFITEAPLGATGPLTWYTLEHVVLVLVTCHYLRLNPKVAARQLRS